VRTPTIQRFKASIVLALVLSTGLSCSRLSNSFTENHGTSSPSIEKDSKNGFAKLTERVIYGADGRHDLYSEPDPKIRAVADSTVAVVKKADLIQNPDGSYHLRTADYGTSYNLCPTEPFREQKVASFCSGFLVGPDTIASAGHCLISELDCNDVAFIFGYAYSAQSSNPYTIPASEVFTCRQILHTQYPSDGADFSLTRIDRVVQEHWPLRLREFGDIKNNDDVMVIGYPVGLPLKIAGGAQVRDASPSGYFVANLDTYGGNSGSAVFNSNTLEVEGILVRGERDYVWDYNGGCLVSNVCENSACRGESVTKINEVVKWLARAQAQKTPGAPNSTSKRSALVLQETPKLLSRIPRQKVQTRLKDSLLFPAPHAKLSELSISSAPKLSHEFPAQMDVDILVQLHLSALIVSSRELKEVEHGSPPLLLAPQITPTPIGR
jgi:V8-like Glu-specific endopeptidase